MTQRLVGIFLCFGMLVCGLVYYQGLQGPFLLDDLQTIEMARINQLSLTELISVCFTNEAGPLYRPLSILSFILTDWFFGQGPVAYKTINLFIHMVCGLLAFACLRKCLPKVTQFSHSQAQTIALMVTFLWWVHPLMVSTTLYAVQRMAQLSACFMLATLWCYVYARFDARTPKHRYLGFSLFFVCWILAIFSKENGLLVPFFVSAIEVCALFQHKGHKNWAMLSITTSGLLIIAALLYYMDHLDSFKTSFQAQGFTLTEYLGIQAKALVFYLKMIVIPNINQMGLYHDDFIYNTTSIWTALAVLGALVVTSIVCLKKFPWISFGIWWFFAAHALESSILPLEPVFEHRNYLASIGILLALSATLYLLLEKNHLNRFKFTLPLVWIFILATFGFIRVQGWSTPQAFLSVSNMNHPLSARTQIETANFLLNHGQLPQALDVLKRASELSPHNSGPTIHQVLAYCFLQAPPNDLIQQAHKDLTEKNITPYTILVFDAMVKNQFNDVCPSIGLDQTLSLLEKAIDNEHIAYKPHYQAVLFHLKAGILVKQQKLDLAIETLEQSYQLNPKRIEPLLEKTQLLILKKEQALAESHLEVIRKHKKIKIKANQQKLKELEDQLELI